MITDEQIKEFCTKVQALQGVAIPVPTVISYERGRKYARIVSKYGDQRSAWGFVDLSNGDILKAASWAAPARHARGNIHNGVEDCTRYGPAYLR